MTEPCWKDLSSVVQERFTQENLLKHQKRLKTGCPSLDKLFGGGIYPGLIVLGGSPNLGKSTFAIQLSEAVSEQTPVLYFSLEMTEERIASKLISRYLFLNRETLHLRTDQCLTGDQLLTGMPEQEPWGEEVLQAVEKARLDKEAVLKNLFIITAPLSAADIAKTAEEFWEQHSGLSFPPLVVVDYLQILPPSSTRNWNEKQAVEDSLKYMVQLAHKGLPVILISSLSRGSYKSPTEISSFKETGGIEYSADILLGLQFQACHKKNMNLSAEKDKVPREVELFILKQRYGKSDCGVRFNYYSANDCFLEETIPREPEEASESLSPPEQDSMPAIDRMEMNGAESLLDGMDCMETDGAIFIPDDIIEMNNIDASSQDPLNADFTATVVSDPTNAGEPAAAVQEEAAEPEKKKRRSVPRSVMCNTKVANEIRQGISGDGNRCEVFSDVYTTYDLSDPLSCFDCDVADAIYTLLSKNKQESFSVRHVLQSLSGDERQTLTEQKKLEITNSIERLRDTIIIIQCEEELRRREIKQKKPPSGIQVFQGQFLNVRQENGKYFFEKDGDPPMPLYAYGEKTNQMISFPNRLLHILHAGGRKLSDTEDAICVKRYLIRRLEILRSKQKRGGSGFQSISFREDRELVSLLKLYDHCSSKESRAQKLRKLRTTVLQVLSYYKQIGYIQNYQAARQYVEIIGKPQSPWDLQYPTHDRTPRSKAVRPKK